MRSLLTRYHLILLGLAVLLGLASAAVLIQQSRDFENAFETPISAGKQGPKPSATLSNGISTLDLLKKPAVWAPREDGASPYVSRPYLLKGGKLIDPMEGNEPLYPPVPNQWLIDHQLDYADMNILDRDPKRKGFTVREEFEAGTDPNNPRQFPPLCNKLRFDESGMRKTAYLLEFIGVEETEAGKKEFQIRPVLPIPNPARGNRPDASLRVVAQGDSVPGAPFLKVVDFQKKNKTINDTEYDVSELILLNTLTEERHVMVQKNGSREYRKTPIELIESISFSYQLAGAPDERIAVERGKEFSLSSLDKGYTETYKLKDISKEGVILEKEGKNFVVKPFSQTLPQESNTAPSNSPQP